MGSIRFRIITVLSFLAAIISEGLLRKIFAVSLCGFFAFNSSICSTYLSHNSIVNAASPSTKNSSTNIVTLNQPCPDSDPCSYTPVEATELSSINPNPIKQPNCPDRNTRCPILDAWSATKNKQFGQYDTILKRSEYYDSIDNILQSNSNTSSIKFFEAARDVTSKYGVGAIETFELAEGGFFVNHSKITKEFLTEINKELFDRNTEVIKLLLDNGYAIHPSSKKRISGFDFDIAMTEFEQKIVENLISTKKNNPKYKQAFEEINKDVNFEGFFRTIGENLLVGDLNNATDSAKEVLGVKKLEYKCLKHRMAIAQALIHIKHKKNGEFINYWKSKKPDCKDTKKRDGKLDKSGKSYGDPHLITFDGFRYGFQTVGEFILTKSKDRKFEVQTRQAPVNRNLSMNSAVAMKVGSDRVAFYSKDFPDTDTSTYLRVNGKPTVIQGNKLTLPGGGAIFKAGDEYTVDFPTGEKVLIAPETAGGNPYFNVSPFVFKQANLYEGLLGNTNGNSKDELNIRGGQNLSVSQSTYGDIKQLLSGTVGLRLPGQLNAAEKIYFDQVNKEFGNSWRVKQEESLFDYPSGKITQNYTDLSFPEKYLKLDMLSSQQLEKARKECTSRKLSIDLMEGCIFDVGFTGFSEFAYTVSEISGYVDIVNQLIPGLNIPKPNQVIDSLIDKVKPKVCLPFVGCL